MTTFVLGYMTGFFTCFAIYLYLRHTRTKRLVESICAERDKHRTTGMTDSLGMADVCDYCGDTWSSGTGTVPLGCPTYQRLGRIAEDVWN